MSAELLAELAMRALSVGFAAATALVVVRNVIR